MKKLSVLFICCLVCTAMGYAQKSFYSGALVIGVNYGVDGNVANQRYFNPQENTAATLNGTVPASNWSVNAEFGLLNWLGVGLIGRIDNYYSQNNQLTHTSTTAGATDLGGTVNIHLIRFKHTDLLVGGDWGVSSFTYNTNDGLNTNSYGSGDWGDIHATARLYFERLGFNLNLFVPYTSYTNLKTNNQDAGQFVVNYWKSTGYGASVGLQYRLF